MNDDAPTLIYCNLFYITLPPHNPVYRDGYMGSGAGDVTLANMAKNPSYTCTTACKGGNHMQIPCLQHKLEDKRVTRMNCCPLRATSMVKGTPHMMAREMLQMMCMCPSREQSDKFTYWN